MKSISSLQKLLFVFFFFIVAMVAARMMYSGKYYFVFIIWNIILAWVPYFLSGFFKQENRNWRNAGVFAAWLLFFPNALYIVTDLVHINESEVTVQHAWFDALLIFSASVLGLVLAFISLNRVEKFLLLHFHKKVMSFIVPGLLLIGSFGVYLGRFLRWNSWDIIHHPYSLIHSVAERLIFPFDHLVTWGVTLTLTGLFYFLYLMAKKIP